ncbi:pantoate--beta-alanine ligase [Bacillus canaveralius]|uniref:Pantothenate synthetase n=1 Tax=Bacillus canaveralius TaxID=1403243 RepID=A0A2N5GI32_9BACI|nr:pantoate--beta-alanine ligase [Bacillus canaveralius]PLR80461.1 pantoate--beta-alanine ligase [Bacillus canaveralius]PLS00674.1 pantoate--beta-alanine ligase [Bacillus canaveralius]
MKVITAISNMQKQMLTDKAQCKSIGFVPTMGFLHDGHASLLRKARAENDLVVLSIFVNPLQFGPNEDLDAYPRDFDRDNQLAEQLGTDYIFAPSADEMYPGPPSVVVKTTARTEVLCGKSRPGHFDGVATVLTKLFNIVRPDRVYFGMKDAQQVAVVEGLLADFHFPIELVAGETVREPDGLAKSSRNVYLLPNERSEAAFIYKALRLAEQMAAAGEKSAAKIQAAVETVIRENTTGQIDYLEILTYPDLEQVGELKGKIIVAAAVRFQKARLIDNIILTIE